MKLEPQFTEWLMKRHAPTSAYDHNKTGEDNADASSNDCKDR